MKCIIPILSLLILVGCGKKPSQEKKEVTVAKPTFSLPALPSVITTDEQKYEFLAENYWTNFNFKDTTQIHQNPIAEQLFHDYLGLLAQVPIDTAKKGMEKMIQLSEVNTNMYNHFLSLSEKVLYDPNSALRNEELYCVILENLLASKNIDKAHKIRPRHRYELAQKNRIGTKAFDFKYTLKSGKQGTLRAIKAEYTLIYFNNPGCGDCKRVKQQLTSSSILTNLLQSGKVKLLSIYPDEDLNEWHKDYSSAPTIWINAYDKGTVVKNKELYDLKAIPTMYLLDKDKRVLLKDARFEEIEHYISTKINDKEK